jgi:hypothetical protein
MIDCTACAHIRHVPQLQGFFTRVLVSKWLKLKSWDPWLMWAVRMLDDRFVHAYIFPNQYFPFHPLLSSALATIYVIQFYFTWARRGTPYRVSIFVCCEVPHIQFFNQYYDYRKYKVVNQLCIWTGRDAMFFILWSHRMVCRVDYWRATDARVNPSGI